MRIKKFTAILLTAAMALSLAACEAKPQETEEFDVNAFYEKAETEVCDGLTQLSESDNYLNLYYSQIKDNEYFKVVKGAKRVDKGTFYEVKVTEAFNTIYDAVGADFSLDALSDFEMEYIKKRMSASVPSFFSGRLGVDAVMLSSILTYAKTFVPGGEMPDTLRIVPTDKDDIYIWVCYTNVGDGAVNVTTTYLPVGKDGLDPVKEIFGDKLVEVTK